MLAERKYLIMETFSNKGLQSAFPFNVFNPLIFNSAYISIHIHTKIPLDNKLSFYSITERRLEVEPERLLDISKRQEQDTFSLPFRSLRFSTNH